MKYFDEDLTEWLSGTPEHVGEYNASNCQVPEFLRWWNGEYWSCFYLEDWEQSEKNRCAKKRERNPSFIEYRGLKVKP